MKLLASLLLVGACAMPPATALDVVVSDLSLAWVSYDRAKQQGDAQAVSEARAEMLEVLTRAAGLGLDLSAVVPKPGIVILVSELMPDASAVEVEMYSKVLTALLSAG